MTDTAVVTPLDASGPYQTCAPLSALHLEQLEASILAYGVLEPVHVDENFAPLDGHHRIAICRKHGIDYPVTVVPGLTDEQKRDRNRTLNADRRQMTPPEQRAIFSQRRERIATLLSEQPGESNLAIARMLGVSDHTVAKVREQNGERSPEARRDSSTVPKSHSANSAQPDYQEPQERAENHANHKAVVMVRLLVTYPAPSEETRQRDGIPYSRESASRTWDSGEFAVTTPAPKSLVEQQQLFTEALSAAHRLAVERPLETVRRG